jgi:hypothetical protein
MVSVVGPFASFIGSQGIGLTFVMVVASMVASADVVGEDVTGRPIVASFERFHADDQPPAAAGGRLLLGELNCTSCHVTSATAQVLKKQAPILDEVGRRVRPDYVREFLTDPHKIKPGTTMPNVFGGQSAVQTQRQVEALVHLLASTGDIRESAPITAAARRGETLFHTIGCVACHNPQPPDAPKLGTSVPLPPVMEEKYSVPGLAEFLSDPLHSRPAGRMTLDESRDLACYLLRDLEIEGTLKFAYYEGNWQNLPDFSKLTPKSNGKATGFDVNLGAQDHFGVVFDGLFRVPRDGKYKFFLGSDDGSRLLINSKQVVERDGIHPISFGEGTIDLTAGVHEIHVEYFEQGGEQELRVDYEGPELKRQSVEFALVASREQTKQDERLVVNAELAAEGERLFGSLGCAACHQLRRAASEKQIASQQNAKPLDSLNLSSSDAAAGCLGNDNRIGIPGYRLTRHQAQSIAAAMTNLRTGDKPSGNNVIADTLTAFNCRACHARDKLGGVDSARNASFKSNQPEMGDEGRIPPSLDGVGAKLKSDWLRHLFNNGANDRPYMFTRMPRFGEGNVGQLVSAFEAADAVTSLPEVKTEIPDRRLKAAGRRLVGAQGFSCIKCHTWGNVKATGIQSIGMTTMTRRLKQGWFEPYLLDPQPYRPGTRMPAAWPQGQVLLPKLLDGKAATQIHSVWKYLSDGDNARMPTGLGGNPIQLIAVDEPVLYRNFIDGAGPRAIGVGYPERVNIAFDANNMRLAMIWHNAFIDAAKHWLGRGPGYQTPLGDNVLELHDGAPLATLVDPKAPWPTQTARQLGHRFLGYRLNEHHRPIFKYRFGDVQVEDYSEPVSDKEFAPLRRTLQFTARQANKDLWFRALAAKSIESKGNGTYLVEGQWTIKLSASHGRPLLRQTNGKAELLVPILAESSSETVRQEFFW